ISVSARLNCTYMKCFIDDNVFFFASRRRHKISKRDWSSDVCSSDLMKADVVRAREQLDEVRSILKESKLKIRDYNLPVIPNTYFVELKEAGAAIKEIIKELDKKPITITTLNTRVDTARDLVLKLYMTTKELLKTAMF